MLTLAGIVRDLAGIVLDQSGTVRDLTGIVRDLAGIVRDLTGMDFNEAGIVCDGGGMFCGEAGIVEGGVRSMPSMAGTAVPSTVLALPLSLSGLRPGDGFCQFGLMGCNLIEGGRTEIDELLIVNAIGLRANVEQISATEIG